MSRASAPPSSIIVAFAVGCLGIAVFSSMDAVVKGLTIAIGTYNTLFWRGLAGIPLAGIPWLLRRPNWPTGKILRLHIWRGVVCAVMAFLFFWGLARTPMAQAIALTFIAPLIAQGLAVLLLGERLKRSALIGSALGLAGVIVILGGAAHQEAGPETLLGTAAIILSALCYAYNIILMRQQSQVADPYEVAFFQNVTVATCLALVAPWFAVVPSGEHVPMIILASALASLSLFLLAWAYARAEASYLAPVEFTAFIWASLWGWVMFSEPVGLLTALGAALIVAGCLIAARAGNIERDVIA